MAIYFRELKAKTKVQTDVLDQQIPCSTCNRLIRARIGLVSHQRHMSPTHMNLIQEIMMVILNTILVDEYEGSLLVLWINYFSLRYSYC